MTISWVKCQMTNFLGKMPDVPDLWPVVINNSLKDVFIAQYLQSQGHKIRYADSTVPSTVIFPKSSIAFMITHKDDVLTEVSKKSEKSQLRQEFIDRMDKFTKMHRNCYLLLKATLVDKNVWNAIQKMQQRFIDSRLQLIFAEKDMDCIQAMTTIAQATCKPTSTVLQSKLQQHLANQLTDETILRILQQTGLSEHDCLVLQQGLGSLSNISQASKQQLLDCSLSPEAVYLLTDFLQKDSQTNL